MNDNRPRKRIATRKKSLCAKSLMRKIVCSPCFQSKPPETSQGVRAAARTRASAAGGIKDIGAERTGNGHCGQRTIDRRCHARAELVRPAPAARERRRIWRATGPEQSGAAASLRLLNELDIIVRIVEFVFSSACPHISREYPSMHSRPSPMSPGAKTQNLVSSEKHLPPRQVEKPARRLRRLLALSSIASRPRCRKSPFLAAAG
jgi:hypothetical protein